MLACGVGEGQPDEVARKEEPSERVLADLVGMLDRERERVIDSTDLDLVPLGIVPNHEIVEAAIRVAHEEVQDDEPLQLQAELLHEFGRPREAIRRSAVGNGRVQGADLRTRCWRRCGRMRCGGQ